MQHFREDPQARTAAAFALGASTVVTAAEIGMLKIMAGRDAAGNARICLHATAQSIFHDMIILETNGGRYYRPHKHSHKEETCHILEGCLDVVLFEDDGRIQHRWRLERGRAFVARIGADTWHTILPVTPYCIYHESKPGPFVPDADALYPAWAPDGEDKEMAERYLRQLREVITP